MSVDIAAIQALVHAPLLRDRVAVITGAGRGIGQSIAALFAASGSKVMINDLDESTLCETKAICVSLGGNDCVATSTGSIIDSSYTTHLMAAANETFRSLDILVNNAGITDDAMVHKMDDDAWRRVIDVNLTGTFNCCRATAPYLRDVAKHELSEKGSVRHHRKIVNFYSTSAIHGNIGQINYAAAKMGNIGLTRSLAREWAPFHINVNAVAPGFTDTRMTQEKASSDDRMGIPRQQRDALIARLPFGRPADPLEVAKVVLFLASSLSDWVTGQELNVSGGQQIP